MKHPAEMQEEATQVPEPATATPTLAKARKSSAKKRAKKSSKNAAKKSSKIVPTGKQPFPNHSIDECRKIADTIRQFNAGNPWSPVDVAAALNMGTGDNFFYLTQSSRDYGLTTGTRASTKIDLADIGRRMVYPKAAGEEPLAILSAFNNIPLFKNVYDYYQGENLPEIEFLKNTLKTEFGVEEAHQDKFYKVYQKNLAYLKQQGIAGKFSPASLKQSNSGGSSIILGESTNAGNLVAFVAMPFSEKTSDYPTGYFDEVLKHLITPAAVNANFNARTAKKSGSEVIQSTIVNDLDSADLVIVDLTEHNPNVLFELGMRIAFNKPVCLIRAKGTGAIFDIDHMLRVYDYNPCLWASTLEIDVPALCDHIAETWRMRDTERSYLNILRESK